MTQTADSTMTDEIHEKSPFARLYSALPPTAEGRTLIISRHGESLYNLEDRGSIQLDIENSVECFY